MKFSASKNSFYDPAFTSVFPADAVDVAAATYTTIQAEISAGNVLSSDSSGNPITVDPKTLVTVAQAQATQSAALSASCASAIVSGFSSSALGSAHTYPSQPNDQSNLIGAATASQSPTLPAGWTCNFWCADSTGAWALRAHTAAQIQQVLADGVAAREALSTKLAALVAQVEAATTVAAVQSIVWA